MEKSLQNKRPRTLFVIEITTEELAKHWEMALPKQFKNPMYIRCTKDGNFSWADSCIYNKEEIEKRELVKVLPRNK